MPDVPVAIRPGLRPLIVAAGALALALLAATLAWHFPLMLWDHLDLLPMYLAWQHGELLQSGFLRIHGGHLHTAAYVVLLGTTWLSHGRPWLDCLASWCCLVAYAAIVLHLVWRTLLRDADARVDAPAWIAIVAAGLALYPGHLANLQWGWQVAIFLCLAGSALAIACLTAPVLDWRRNLVALAATGLALLSFANALALVPIAVVALLLRPDLDRRQRLIAIAPWLAVCLVALVALRSTAHVIAHFSPDSVAQAWQKLPLATVALYSLNYLGAGVLRFAPALAPWAGALLVAGGAWLAWRLRARAAAWPWIALLAYVVIGAGLTALARHAEGAEQAFAARYVSFSSLGWLAGLALGVLAARDAAWPAAARRGALAALAVLAMVNAAQMTLECAQLGAATRVTAQTLCRDGDEAPAPMLADLYYAGPDAARERLRTLRELRFAPFDACTAGTP